jgi:hypothetical protein
MPSPEYALSEPSALAFAIQDLSCRRSQEGHAIYQDDVGVRPMITGGEVELRLREVVQVICLGIVGLGPNVAPVHRVYGGKATGIRNKVTD